MMILNTMIIPAITVVETMQKNNYFKDGADKKSKRRSKKGKVDPTIYEKYKDYAKTNPKQPTYFELLKEREDDVFRGEPVDLSFLNNE